MAYADNWRGSIQRFEMCCTVVGYTRQGMERSGYLETAGKQVKQQPLTNCEQADNVRAG